MHVLWEIYENNMHEYVHLMHLLTRQPFVTFWYNFVEETITEVQNLHYAEQLKFQTKIFTNLNRCRCIIFSLQTQVLL
jgi:hypothetical protein